MAVKMTPQGLVVGRIDPEVKAEPVPVHPPAQEPPKPIPRKPKKE